MGKIYDRNDTREVVVTKECKVTGVKCDICGRIIPAHMYREKESKYFRVTTGHNDWGHDSIESIEHKDVCPECIGKFTTDYLADNYDTAYIDIETEHAYAEYERV